MVRYFTFVSHFSRFCLITFKLTFVKVDKGLLQETITFTDNFMSH